MLWSNNFIDAFQHVGTCLHFHLATGVAYLCARTIRNAGFALVATVDRNELCAIPAFAKIRGVFTDLTKIGDSHTRTMRGNLDVKLFSNDSMNIFKRID
jgi:hypothetical protein